MSEKAKSNLNTLLLIGMNILLGVIVWGGYHTVNAVETANDNIIKMEKENTAQHNKFINTLNSHKLWTENVYKYEIQPNTERSKQNAELLQAHGIF